MDRKQEKEQTDAEAAGKRPGRGWTERFTGPIRYRRFTDTDVSGRPSILFKFELAPGQSDLPQEVYDVLHQMKHLDRGAGHGDGQHHSGLTFQRGRQHGKVWRLPDNETGRTTADIIDAKLSDLAHKLEQQGSPGR